jgi:hypothetical protein
MFIATKPGLIIALLIGIIFTSQLPRVAGSAQLVTPNSQSQTTQPEVSVSLRPIDDVVQAGSPVKVAFVITKGKGVRNV